MTLGLLVTTPRVRLGQAVQKSGETGKHVSLYNNQALVIGPESTRLKLRPHWIRTDTL